MFASWIGRVHQRITYGTRFVDLIGMSHLSWYTSDMEDFAILDIYKCSWGQNIDVHLCEFIADGLGSGNNALQERFKAFQVEVWSIIE